MRGLAATQAQLRIYDIKPGFMEERSEKFHAEIVPVREQYDFEVVGSWVHEDGNQFVFVVAYDGELDWEAAVDRCYHSPERQNINLDAKAHIDEADFRMLRPAA